MERDRVFVSRGKAFRTKGAAKKVGGVLHKLAWEISEDEVKIIKTCYPQRGRNIILINKRVKKGSFITYEAPELRAALTRVFPDTYGDLEERLHQISLRMKGFGGKLPNKPSVKIPQKHLKSNVSYVDILLSKWGVQPGKIARKLANLYLQKRGIYPKIPQYLRLYSPSELGQMSLGAPLVLTSPRTLEAQKAVLMKAKRENGLSSVVTDILRWIFRLSGQGTVVLKNLERTTLQDLDMALAKSLQERYSWTFDKERLETTIAGFTVRSLKEPQEYEEWGEYARNCVSGYADEDSTIITFDNGDRTQCLTTEWERRDGEWRCMQARGWCNARPTEEQSKLVKALESHKNQIPCKLEKYLVSSEDAASCEFFQIKED